VLLSLQHDRTWMRKESDCYYDKWNISRGYLWHIYSCPVVTNGTYMWSLEDIDIHVMTPIERTVSKEMKDFW